MYTLLVVLARHAAWLALVLIAASLGGCASTHRSADPSAASASSAAPDLDAQRITLRPGVASARVNGLSCPLCAESLIATINRIDGVGNASLDLGSGTLTMDIGKQPPSAERIERAIDDAGFTFVGFIDP